MYKKLAILLFFTAITCLANGQQVPIQYFFRQIDNRGYHGDYKAYCARVFADSSIEVRVYILPGWPYGSSMQKMTYYGRYYQQQDSCIIRYWTSYTEHREVNTWFKTLKRRENKNDSLPGIKFNPSGHFIIQGSIITFSGWLIPQLPRSTAVQVNMMETVFQRWGKSFNQQYFPGIAEENILTN